MAGKGGAIAGGAATGASLGSVVPGFGTAIGGILGGIGGALGAFGGSDNGPGLGGLVKRARRLGLHPLSVLGSPIAGNYATPSASRDVGGALSALGDAVGSTSRYFAERKEARELADRARRQDDLNAARVMAEAKLAGAQTRNIDAETAQILLGARSASVASRANSVRNSAGYPKVPGLAAVTDMNGKVVGYVPNPDLLEAMEDVVPQLLTAATAVKTGLDPRELVPSEFRSAPPSHITEGPFRRRPQPGWMDSYFSGSFPR